MKTVNEYCREQFGEKLYKLSLNGGMTCPNRDGTLGTRGCIFCSEGGSGDFTPSTQLSMEQQIEEAKKRVGAKYHGKRYIAYFQAYTNTYAPVSYLRDLFFPIIQRDDIAALSIATRPDCLGSDVLTLLRELNAIKPVWVELGLQTIHEKTATLIRRGYPLSIYDTAVRNLTALGIHVITHVILYLPGESREEMLSTVSYVGKSGSQGIKLQMLHILDGTDIASTPLIDNYSISLDEYSSLIADCLTVLPDNMVIHRLTGDGPKKILLAPLWSGNKKMVINRIRQELHARNIPLNF